MIHIIIKVTVSWGVEQFQAIVPNRIVARAWMESHRRHGARIDHWRMRDEAGWFDGSNKAWNHIDEDQWMEGPAIVWESPND